jgi:hypothetical protein
MKNVKLFLSAFLLLIAATMQAQTVDEIINKHIEAIGGKEILKQVKTLYIENSMEIMGNEAPFTEYFLDGKGYKSETEFNGAKIINCVTDNGGWSVNPMMGGTDAQTMPETLYQYSKPQIYIGGALLDYAAKGYKVELIGKEKGSYKIKMSDNKTETFYFIDETSFYLTKSNVKSEMMGQSVDVITTFSGYKKTDIGFVLAYEKNVDMGMFQLNSKVSKVEVNKEIDPKIFDIPK